MHFNPIDIIFTPDEKEEIILCSQQYLPAILYRSGQLTIVFPQKPDHMTQSNHMNIIQEYIKAVSSRYPLLKEYQLLKTQLHYD